MDCIIVDDATIQEINNIINSFQLIDTKTTYKKCKKEVSQISLTLRSIIKGKNCIDLGQVNRVITDLKHKLSELEKKNSIWRSLISLQAPQLATLYNESLEKVKKIDSILREYINLQKKIQKERISEYFILPTFHPSINFKNHSITKFDHSLKIYEAIIDQYTELISAKSSKEGQNKVVEMIKDENESKRNDLFISQSSMSYQRFSEIIKDALSDVCCSLYDKNIDIYLKSPSPNYHLEEAILNDILFSK